MRARWPAIAGAVALLAATPVQAQLAVYDATSYGKLLQQAQTALQQLRELQAQVQQSERLYESLNVNSKVNAIASQLGAPELRQFLPDVSTYSAAQGQFGELGRMGARAQQIRAANRIYTPDGDASYHTESLEQAGDRAARDMALGESVADAGAQRLQGLEQLRHSLDGAGDARAVLDIQARISAETAMIQNDQMRLQGIAMVQQAQDRLQTQRDREQARKSHEEAEAIFRSSAR